MKFYVKVIAAPSVPGKKALALCAEDGTVVGRQRQCTVDCEACEIGLLKVTFFIDGETLIFADNDEEVAA
jgi:hypothetical protein